MAIRSKEDMLADIHMSMELLESQLEVVRRRAAEMGIQTVELMDTSGNYVILPLLLARAQLSLAEQMVGLG